MCLKSKWAYKHFFGGGGGGGSGRGGEGVVVVGVAIFKGKFIFQNWLSL